VYHVTFVIVYFRIRFSARFFLFLFLSFVQRANIKFLFVLVISFKDQGKPCHCDKEGTKISTCAIVYLSCPIYEHGPTVRLTSHVCHL